MKDPFDRPARPWDLYNKNLGRVMPIVQKERMAICEGCPMLVAGVCKECGCFMASKTKLPNAYCPLHKWEAERISFTEDQNDR